MSASLHYRYTFFNCHTKKKNSYFLALKFLQSNKH